MGNTVTYRCNAGHDVTISGNTHDSLCLCSEPCMFCPDGQLWFKGDFGIARLCEDSTDMSGNG